MIHAEQCGKSKCIWPTAWHVRICIRVLDEHLGVYVCVCTKLYRKWNGWLISRLQIYSILAGMLLRKFQSTSPLCPSPRNDMRSASQWLCVCLTFGMVKRLVYVPSYGSIAQSNRHGYSQCCILKHIRFLVYSQLIFTYRSTFLECTYSKVVWICIQSHYLHSFHCDDKFHCLFQILFIHHIYVSRPPIHYFMTFWKIIVWTHWHGMIRDYLQYCIMFFAYDSKECCQFWLISVHFMVLNSCSFQWVRMIRAWNIFNCCYFYWGTDRITIQMNGFIQFEM